MPDVWWLIAATPAGKYVWPLGQRDDPALENLIMAARHAIDFPIDWVETPDCRIHIAPGDPHPTLLAAATIGTRAQLEAVPPADVDAYRQRVAQAHATARYDAAKSALAALDDTQLRAVLADPDVARRTQFTAPTRGAAGPT